MAVKKDPKTIDSAAVADKEIQFQIGDKVVFKHFPDWLKHHKGAVAKIIKIQYDPLAQRTIKILFEDTGHALTLSAHHMANDFEHYVDPLEFIRKIRFKKPKNGGVQSTAVQYALYNAPTGTHHGVANIKVGEESA